jgi:DNA-binding transcriptional MerR regulator
MITIEHGRDASDLANSLRPSYRSGAVARMAGMPVATLRIWQQRYQAVQPITSASGQRLYSAADVERVSVLRRLTEKGYAIGLLAALDTRQLLEMMNVSNLTRSSIDVEMPPKQTTISIVVVGQALARRLKRKKFQTLNGLTLKWVGAFDSLAESTQAALDSTGPKVDLILMHVASLQPGAQQELRVAQEAWQAHSTAVVYGYSNTAARAEFIHSDTPLLQEPIDDESLSQWLTELEITSTNEDKRHTNNKLDNRSVVELTEKDVSAPKFTDDALTAFAGMSSTIACECPSHLAKLLMQISHFETYSSDCNNRNAADAQLHAYLHKVSGVARMLFETALEHVAIAEGIPLPSHNSENI